MSWEELINHILTTSSKVEKIVVYDSKGRPVAITDDVETRESEGLAIVRCLSDHTKTVTRLHIDNDVFQCLHGINKSLIGKKLKDLSCMMVARQDGDHVVVIMGRPDGEESFLWELKDGLQRKANGTLISQLRQQQQQPQQPLPGQLLPIPPSPASRAGRSKPKPVTTDEVLVDITG